jgi:hypothetical protein
VNIRDRYTGSRLADLVHDTARKIDRRYVSYGPVRGNAREFGAFAWQCDTNACCTDDKGEWIGAVIGGYTDTIDDARTAAEAHARTHRGVRAFYYKG